MYFFRIQGKQAVDFRGNLILSHNADLVSARVGSAAPKMLKNCHYIIDIPNLKFIRKIRATCAAIGWIWGTSQALKVKALEDEYNLTPAVVHKSK